MSGATKQPTSVTSEGSLIHTHVYDPGSSPFGKKSDKAMVMNYYCDRSSECDAHKNGRCIMVGKPFGPRCFGRKTERKGPTKRARSFGDFLRAGRASEKYRALSTQPNKIFKVGEGYMMPYAHINLSERSPFESKAGFMISGMPYIENPSADDLSIIYTQKPQALFGGEIVDYQRKVVPQFVKHLHDEYPKLYEYLLLLHPDAKKHVENFDYIGKKAVIGTLLPGEITISKNVWRWDGQYLTGSGRNMIFCPGDATEVRVKPNPEAVVEVSSNDLVGENTKIID